MRDMKRQCLASRLLGVLFISLIIPVVLTLSQPQVVVAVSEETDGIDEIVVIGEDGRVYVYDITGEEVFRSPQGGWIDVATADLNGDGDDEIIAISPNTIQAFDPQIIGDEYTYEVTYSRSGGALTKVGVGNFLASDDDPEIALLWSANDLNDGGRIILLDPPLTSPHRDEAFATAWSDFAVGDYDGDHDDDFALIYYNDDNPSGLKNWVELRKGNEPKDKLENSDNAGQYSDSQWFDIASGDFITSNGSRVEWVGTQNLEPNVVAQEWRDSAIEEIWTRSQAFEFLATADFRNEDVDQVVMLRNITSGTSLQFVNNQGLRWAELTNLGTGWLNLAAGNLDTETTYREAVILKKDLIRVYRIAQSTASAMDCNPSSECLEISGSFKGPLVVGDLGVDFEQIAAYETVPTNINRRVSQDESIPPAKFSIYGEVAYQTPLTWGAIPLPYLTARELEADLKNKTNLRLSISGNRLYYENGGGTGDIPSVPWIALSAYTGVTPAEVTITFSDTTTTSAIYEDGVYRATILVWQNELLDDRFRFVDVTVVVGPEPIYLPLIIR